MLRRLETLLPLLPDNAGVVVNDWGVAALLVVVFLLMVFMVTSVDSGSLVVDNLAAGGMEDTPVHQRVLWVGLIGLVAMVLFVVGGDSALKGVQAGAIAMGLPYMTLMLVLMVGFVKSLIQDVRA